jgi:hypothetical protein
VGLLSAATSSSLAVIRRRGRAIHQTASTLSLPLLLSLNLNQSQSYSNQQLVTCHDYEAVSGRLRRDYSTRRRMDLNIGKGRSPYNNNRLNRNRFIPNDQQQFDQLQPQIQPQLPNQAMPLIDSSIYPHREPVFTSSSSSSSSNYSSNDNSSLSTTDDSLEHLQTHPLLRASSLCIQRQLETLNIFLGTSPSRKKYQIKNQIKYRIRATQSI